MDFGSTLLYQLLLVNQALHFRSEFERQEHPNLSVSLALQRRSRS